MATIYKEAKVNASVDQLWKAISDVGNIDKLLGFLESAEMDGNVRTCAIEGGGVLSELIISIDEERRRVAYTITESPFGFEHHSASMRAVADGETSVFIWETDVMPDAMLEALEPVLDGGINDIRNAVEAANA